MSPAGQRVLAQGDDLEYPARPGIPPNRVLPPLTEVAHTTYGVKTGVTGKGRFSDDKRFIDGAVTPEKCLEAYHLQRTRFELVAARKLRNRQLTDDGNVEINGRDLRTPSRKTAVKRHPSVYPTRSLNSEVEWPQAQS